MFFFIVSDTIKSCKVGKYPLPWAKCFYWVSHEKLHYKTDTQFSIVLKQLSFIGPERNTGSNRTRVEKKQKKTSSASILMEYVKPFAIKM